MKKALLAILFSIIALACMGQNSGALKFMGIPIDGTEEQFSHELRNKGFKYDPIYECYKGQFNGETVDVYIHTNHNLVDRVYVAFPYTTENDIRIKFNRLLSQFNDNGKYLALCINNEIPGDENIHYQISVQNKRYQATFSYFDQDRDILAFVNDFTEKLSKYISKEQADVFRSFVQQLSTIPEDERVSFMETVCDNMQKYAEENQHEMNEEQIASAFQILHVMRSLADGEVWFMIHEFRGKYQIGLYYDNLHNQAHGEDL